MTLSPQDDAALARQLIAEVTPARIFTGRSGTSLPTSVLLQLRGDHAAARDAVHAVLDEDLLPPSDFLRVSSAARDLHSYLRHPGLGRSLSPEGRELLLQEGTRNADVQVVVGDGLSAAAVHEQVPLLLPGLTQELQLKARPILVERCRVGIINEIGALLQPTVVVLLIGERPGLATATSLSAYFAHRPQPGDTDAQRNLISNIHAQGVRPPEAVARIVALVDKLRQAGTSGASVRED